MALTHDVFDSDNTVEWTFHLEYVHDGGSIDMPHSAVIMETEHDPETGRLAVWYKVPDMDDRGVETHGSWHDGEIDE